MDDRPTRAPGEPNKFNIRNAVYRLKFELRREERAGREDTPYAGALRRVLRVLCDHDAEDAPVLLEDELLDLEQRRDVGPDVVQALRKVLALTDTAPEGSNELFRYYLRKMEADGRGHEPFAQALRRAIRSRGRASLDELFVWKRQADSTD